MLENVIDLINQVRAGKGGGRLLVIFRLFRRQNSMLDKFF